MLIIANFFLFLFHEHENWTIEARLKDEEAMARSEDEWLEDEAKRFEETNIFLVNKRFAACISTIVIYDFTCSVICPKNVMNTKT